MSARATDTQEISAADAADADAVLEEPAGPAPSDLTVAELQDIQRQRDALKEHARSLNERLELELIAEGKALSKLATADLRDREARALVRAELDRLDALDKEG